MRKTGEWQSSTTSESRFQRAILNGEPISLYENCHWVPMRYTPHGIVGAHCPREIVE
jgi:hypothetical protein